MKTDIRTYISKRVEEKIEWEAMSLANTVLAVNTIKRKLHLFPDKKVDSMFISRFKVEIRIPWNPESQNEMISELESLGWVLKSDDPRSPEQQWQSIFFTHPELVYKSAQYNYENNIELELCMWAKEDENKSDDQTCRLVLVDKRIETKEVPVYDVICEESYQELMNENM